MGIRQQLAGLFSRKSPTKETGRARTPTQGEEFAVIGLGVFGRNLALRLSELGFTVLGIDVEASVVQALADDLSAALVLDATNEEALRQADIESYSTAIVAIGGDHFEATALTTITLAKIGVPRIIALASTRRQTEILDAIGATRVLNPVEESAVTLADELTDPGRGDTWSITPDDQVALGPLPSSLADQPVSACDRLGVTILLLARDGEVKSHPTPDFLLAADDLVLVHGTPQQVLNFRRLA
jgi:trk system potassium uptake protein TrkA